MTRGMLTFWMALCLVAIRLDLPAQENGDEDGGGGGVVPGRIQVRINPGGEGGMQPRVIMRRGDEIRELDPFGGPPWARHGNDRAHLLGVDIEKETVTVETQPQVGIVGTDNKTVFVRGGKTIARTDLPEQAEILAVYSPAVDRNASAVVQLPLDQASAALRGIVGKVDGGRLTLKDSLIDAVDIEGAVVVVAGKPAEAVDLEPEDAVVVVLTSPSRFVRKALLVMKVSRDDTSLKSVKARVAERPEAADHPMFDRGIAVVSGRPKEVTLSVNDESVLLPKIPAPWARNRLEPMTLQQLKERIERADGDNPLVVLVEFAPPADDEATPTLERLIIQDYSEFRRGWRRRHDREDRDKE